METKGESEGDDLRFHTTRAETLNIRRNSGVIDSLK